MGKYPALDVFNADQELLLAAIDECSPTAVETHDASFTLYFTSQGDRERARKTIAIAFPTTHTHAREVDDEGWARRSQENLKPITVGRITITPPWFAPPQPLTSNLQPLASNLHPLVIVIAPSMGFGTGHHATTRLCLAAMQTVDPMKGLALDVGTGSGVLAIAARLLGADEVVGVDCDADAIQSAEENLAANPAVDRVRFEVADLRGVGLPQARLVTANLTGALLIQSAPLLLTALAPGGTLIVSGLQTIERPAVLDAYGRARLAWEGEEDSWSALGFRQA